MYGLLGVIFCASLAVAYPNEYSSRQLTRKMVNQSEIIHTAPPIAFIRYTKNCSILCGAVLIHDKHMIAPITCVPDEIDLDLYSVEFPKIIKSKSERGIIRKKFYPPADVAVLLLNEELNYDRDGICSSFISFVAPKVNTKVSLVEWNKNFHLRVHIVTMIEIDEEICLNDYYVNQQSRYNQRGRLLYSGGYLLGMATLFHQSRPVGYSNLYKHNSEIYDIVEKDVE